jgi:hypothetical protein
MRPGDMRPGDMRPGDMRPGDMRGNFPDHARTYCVSPPGQDGGHASPR